MLRSHTITATSRLLLAVLTAAAAGCAAKTPPDLGATPSDASSNPPLTTAAPAAVPRGAPPAPPEVVGQPVPMPVREEVVAASSLDDLNRASPLQPVFFALDSSEIDLAGKAVLDANAPLLKRYPGWTVTIEGHCDERGTAEYNLALGERRAVAARAYLVSLGIPADRLRTVSYGKEFPFDPGHEDPAWAKNRRAHFVITAK
jgi:peptidoglycan-associated lipoprotein